MDDVDRLRLTIRRSTAVIVFVLALVGVIIHDAATVVHGYYPTDSPAAAYLLAIVLVVGSAGYLFASPIVASMGESGRPPAADDGDETSQPDE